MANKITSIRFNPAQRAIIEIVRVRLGERTIASLFDRLVMEEYRRSGSDGVPPRKTLISKKDGSQK